MGDVSESADDRIINVALVYAAHLISMVPTGQDLADRLAMLRLLESRVGREAMRNLVNVHGFDLLAATGHKISVEDL
jgi:hypothetical protein